MVEAKTQQQDQHLTGLSGEEAARRLLQYGPNALPVATERGFFQLFPELAREPIFLLLIVAGLIYMVLGDAKDALLLLGFVLATMLIVVSRQRKTEHVLTSLRALSSPRALVVRDKLARRIPGNEVVPGDLVQLEEGDRIAADGKLMDAHDLLVDESLLTGESVPVSRQTGDSVYSGTLVAQGGGMMRVLATGTDTAIGKIGKSLVQVEPGKSPLQREIAILIRRFAIIGLMLSSLMFVLFGWTRGDWLGGLLAGITLSMSILPEEFSVILVVFLTLGAWRIAKSQVLTRHPPVIETLGAATVLCVDKTGTLTQNRMAVAAIATAHEMTQTGQVTAGNLPQTVAEVITFSRLASETAPFDPMEQAFHRCAETLLPEWEMQHQGWKLVHEYALTPAIMAITHVWQRPGHGLELVAAKGAPETMLRLCRLTEEEAALALAQVKNMAAQGLRVLAVASAEHTGAWPAQASGFAFRWLGLIGLADPLRPGVPEAVAQCRRAGLRVVMITGDYAGTAQAIAEQAGLDAHSIMTGSQVDAATDTQLQKMVGEVQVFARTLPHQKLRLVQAFKANHEIVAMTGDGINDAPALKAAHIGISMGQRGTDVAREASSLVLLNDDFGAIVEAVRLGRRIVDNLRKALRYVVGVHMPIAGIALLPLISGTPLVLSPALVMFLEMIINPASSIVFETEHGERDLMQRPPRKPGTALFGTRNIVYALVQGGCLLIACSAVFFTGLRQEWLYEQTRTAVFVTMVMSNLAMIIVSRSDHESMLSLLHKPNAAQWWVITGTLAALVLVLGVPWLRQAFDFGQLAFAQIGIALLASALALCGLELVKFIFARSIDRA